MLTISQVEAAILKKHPNTNSSSNFIFAVQIIVRIACTLSCYPNGDLNTLLQETENCLRILAGYRDSDADIIEDFLKSVATDKINLRTLNAFEQHLNLLRNNEAYRIRFENDLDAANWNINLFRSLYDIQIDKDYLLDCLEIYQLISDRSRWMSMLSHLEEQLQAYAGEQGVPLVDYDGTKKMLVHDNANLKREKILSGFLYRWAQENGFNQQHYVKMLGTLSTYEFFDVLQKKLFFKDSNVFPPLHGVWTHAIQFFVIIELNKIKKFLQHDPIDIYAFLGDAKNASSTTTVTLWFMMLDHQEGRFGDFRCPEKFTEFLLDDYSGINTKTAKFPLLSQSVRRIYAKNRHVTEPSKSAAKMQLCLFQPKSTKITTVIEPLKLTKKTGV